MVGKLRERRRRRVKPTRVVARNPRGRRMCDVIDKADSPSVYCCRFFRTLVTSWNLFRQGSFWAAENPHKLEDVWQRQVLNVVCVCVCFYVAPSRSSLRDSMKIMEGGEGVMYFFVFGAGKGPLTFSHPRIRLYFVLITIFYFICKDQRRWMKVLLAVWRQQQQTCSVF